MIVAITPTGARPEAFALCERYMARQTLQPDLWIVVDDCDPATACTMGQMVLRPEPRWESGNTQHRNLLAALDHVPPGSSIIFFEDDDWYADTYIAKQVERLQRHPLVGEEPARYYHVGHRCSRSFDHTPHASLCATAIHSSMIPELQQCCFMRAWIDTTLWRKYGGRGDLYYDYSVVGIKGLPGRPGVSAAHRNLPGPQWRSDPSMEMLKRWVGDDWKHYAQYGVKS